MRSAVDGGSPWLTVCVWAAFPRVAQPTFTRRATPRPASTCLYHTYLLHVPLLFLFFLLPVFVHCSDQGPAQGCPESLLEWLIHSTKLLSGVLDVPIILNLKNREKKKSGHWNNSFLKILFSNREGSVVSSWMRQVWQKNCLWLSSFIIYDCIHYWPPQANFVFILFYF